MRQRNADCSTLRSPVQCNACISSSGKVIPLPTWPKSKARPTAQLQQVSLSSLRPGARFNDTFRIERLFPLSRNQAKARIRQSGLLATNTIRFSFTSYLPFDLVEGSSYRLEGVLMDRPYRDRQQVRLDVNTRVKRESGSTMVNPTSGSRELHPRPPPA